MQQRFQVQQTLARKRPHNFTKLSIIIFTGGKLWYQLVSSPTIWLSVSSTSLASIFKCLLSSLSMGNQCQFLWSSAAMVQMACYSCNHLYVVPHLVATSVNELCCLSPRSAYFWWRSVSARFSPIECLHSKISIPKSCVRKWTVKLR